MPTKSAKHFKRAAQRDAEVAALGNVPSPDVHQRLHVSKMVFQRLIDESLLARYTLVDGTILPHHVSILDDLDAAFVVAHRQAMSVT